jgi:hypothetical protein
MSVNVNFDEVQEKVQQKLDEKAKSAQLMGRKMSYTALGLVGLTLDAGVSLVHRAEALAERAEKRGEELEATLNSRAQSMQNQMVESAKAQRAKVEEKLGGIAEDIGDRGTAVQEKFQSSLASLKAGSGTVIETDDIRIEVEVLDEQPWEGYDSLNAQEVVDRLSNLDAAALEQVRKYEAGTKNRVTVLRDIDMYLAGFMDGAAVAAGEAGETGDEEL